MAKNIFFLFPQIIGGVLFIICGIITAVGISIVQFVNMDTTRNLFIVGISIFSGICLPEYFKAHPQDVHFGVGWLDQLVVVLITNSLIVTLGKFMPRFLSSLDNFIVITMTDLKIFPSSNRLRT